MDYNYCCKIRSSARGVCRSEILFRHTELLISVLALLFPNNFFLAVFFHAVPVALNSCMNSTFYITVSNLLFSHCENK